MFQDAISLVGPNGSGKTLLLRLLLNLSLPHHVRLSTGDGCRRIVKRESAFLDRLRPLVNIDFDIFVNDVTWHMVNGKLVPDPYIEIIFKALMAEFLEKRSGQPLALDGYPRTMNQKRSLINEHIARRHALPEIDESKKFPLFVIELSLEAKKCLAERMPKQASEQARVDGSQESCEERIKDFEKKTRPILTALRSLQNDFKLTVPRALDASLHPQEVLWRAQDVLGVDRCRIPDNMLPEGIAPYKELSQVA